MTVSLSILSRSAVSSCREKLRSSPVSSRYASSALRGCTTNTLRVTGSISGNTRMASGIGITAMRRKTSCRPFRRSAKCYLVVFDARANDFGKALLKTPVNGKFTIGEHFVDLRPQVKQKSSPPKGVATKALTRRQARTGPAEK